jgi:hypothetical protein
MRKLIIFRNSKFTLFIDILYLRLIIISLRCILSGLKREKGEVKNAYTNHRAIMVKSKELN